MSKPSLQDLIDQVQYYAKELDTPGLDQRLQLYLIRDAAWQAMCEIDHASFKAYLAAKHPQTYTVDDL